MEIKEIVGPKINDWPKFYILIICFRNLAQSHPSPNPLNTKVEGPILDRNLDLHT